MKMKRLLHKNLLANVQTELIWILGRDWKRKQPPAKECLRNLERLVLQKEWWTLLQMLRTCQMPYDRKRPRAFHASWPITIQTVFVLDDKKDPKTDCESRLGSQHRSAPVKRHAAGPKMMWTKTQKGTAVFFRIQVAKPSNLLKPPATRTCTRFNTNLRN